MFCGVENDNSGLAILNRGLPEYAVHEDEERTIGLTLLRTYRFPIIGANPEDVATDETQVMCQCLRQFIFEYAICPYKGCWEEADVYRNAHQFNLRLRLNQVGKSKGSLPKSLDFIKIEPDQLILSAIKKAARNNSLIVRVFNPTEKTVNGSISFWKSIQKAEIVNLNEEYIADAEIDGNMIRVTAAKNKILTFRIEFK
jgi:alpha-mannosidase